MAFTGAVIPVQSHVSGMIFILKREPYSLVLISSMAKYKDGNTFETLNLYVLLIGNHSNHYHTYIK